MIITDDALVPQTHALHSDTWVDIGLAMKRYPVTPDTYKALLLETKRLLRTEQAATAFFIHKPPGVRWRLQASSSSPPAELRHAAMTAAQRIVGLDRVQAAVYEPQQNLFGGEQSMRLVHQTWCADSLLWLHWYAEHPHSTRQDRWTLSLNVLARVFHQLKVVGWEDREVWGHIRDDTGRRLAEHEWTRPEVVTLAKAIQRQWSQLWGAVGHQPDSAQDGFGLDVFQRQAAPALTQWHDDCLSRPGTEYLLTPRRGAAYWTVFHWNRAGLPAAQQALIAQTLAGRREVDLC
jgi:thiopeptide-type bacteriocin biosynthesis protein